MQIWNGRHETEASAKAMRLMVGLHYLKYTFNESDESAVAHWVENPYWQHFCGYTHMEHVCPIHPTSMTKWRNRVGAERLTELLKETIALAVRETHLSARNLAQVNVDTTELVAMCLKRSVTSYPSSPYLQLSRANNAYGAWHTVPQITTQPAHAHLFPGPPVDRIHDDVKNPPILIVESRHLCDYRSVSGRVLVNQKA
ncbi:MAG: transposase [Phycisphaerales bacterium]|nr:transposase [Phycisphaerales bacterium]